MVAGVSLSSRMVTIKMQNRNDEVPLKVSMSKLYLDPELKNTFGYSIYQKTGLSV